MGLLLSVPAMAGYKITLQNGQVLDAETFTVENSKITLKYKVGEVSFPMSMVKSVTNDAGNGDFLAVPSPQTVKPNSPQAPAPMPQQAQPAQPWQPTQPAQPPVQHQAAPQPMPPPQAGLPGVTGDDELDQDDNLDDSNDLPPDEGEQ